MQPEDTVHLDTRFYYRDASSIGRTRCELARTMGAARIRAIETFAHFAEKPWISRIAHARDNAAILRFLVERAVLGILVNVATIHLAHR